jgi:hypothetical protein
MTASLEIDYKQLAAELVAQNASLKAVSATPTAAYGHGPTGLFSAPGVDPTIYNAMQLPAVGLESLLPERPTNVVTPVYNIVTGQTATSGSEPSTACADWPTAGLTKLCGFQTTLSRQGRSTQVFDVTRVGQRINNADMMNYQLAGDPLVGDVSQANSPTFPGAAGNGFLNTELAKAMREVRVAMIRDFAPDIYTGNPANNSGTGRLYYKGLDLLVNTGYADYETSTACPASDSLIVAWTGGDISTAPNGANLVLTLVDMYRRLMIIADESGMSRAELNSFWLCRGRSFTKFRRHGLVPITRRVARFPAPSRLRSTRPIKPKCAINSGPVLTCFSTDNRSALFRTFQFLKPR